MLLCYILSIPEVHHVKIIAANLPKFTKQICKAEAEQLAWRMRYHWWINGQIWQISILYDIFAVAISNSKYISYIIAGVSGKPLSAQRIWEGLHLAQFDSNLVWFCFPFRLLTNKKNNSGGR